jgi:hypothetical protein
MDDATVPESARPTLPADGKRELGFAAGLVRMKDGWERPMTNADADAFIAADE